MAHSLSIDGFEEPEACTFSFWAAFHGKANLTTSTFKPKSEITYRFFESCKSRSRLELLFLYSLSLCIDMPQILNAEVCLFSSLDGLLTQASPISDASKAVKMLQNCICCFTL
jgi:hypothetical protein